jgi:transposase InsO family protein
MPVMIHDQQVGQASDQATEVGRVGAGLPPQRTDPKQGTPERGAMRFTSHINKQTDTNPASQPQASQSQNHTGASSFFSLRQKNVLDTRRWNSREELRLAIVIWIETRYNRRRHQRALGKLTPVEFETIYPAADAT